MWLIIWRKCFLEGEYCMFMGMQLNVFYASKLFVWLNHVKSSSIKKKYESWKTCNTQESFHFYKSFTKIFERKNKSEYNNCFCINLPAISVWSNMSDTIGYLHQTLWTCRNLWPNMSELGRTCPTLIGMFWKTILFWLRTTPILVDHETSCVGKLISLSFHTYEEHPNQKSCAYCVSIWRQCGPRPQDWLKVELCNPELDWISSLACTSTWLSNTLLMSHMSFMIYSFISRERKKKGIRKDWDVSSGCDVEEQVEQWHL
jgi:hypothetical protein